MIPYAIGLDIGIASVGWATVGLDTNERPFCILGMGSRIFDKAEDSQTGASLALPRRQARSMRRRLRRHRHRNERIRDLLVSKEILTQSELDMLFTGYLPDIYQLRVDALDRPVDNKEFARILIHLSQRRGFCSNRKNNKTSSEDGELLKAIDKNQERMKENHYRTVAEMFLKDKNFHNHKRNKDGNYMTTVTRGMVEDEVHQIFSAQRSTGNHFASETLESEYLEILLKQRSFDTGPGKGSPYGSFRDKIGNCTFFPEEERAAKATYSFEYFNLLQKINNIKLINEDGTEMPLSDEQKRTLIDLAFKTETLSYQKIRKELNLSTNILFNTIRYKSESIEDCEKRQKINSLRAYHEMRKVVDGIQKGLYTKLSIEQKDAIACINNMMVRTISNYYKYRENRFLCSSEKFIAHDPYTGKEIKSFPLPWETFYEDTNRWADNVFVSRAPRRKVTGAAHKETFKSSKAIGEGLLIIRKPLSKLKLKDFENYYKPEADPILYNSLKERLIEFNGDAEKAFEEPYHKPGNPAKIVKKIRICEKSTLDVPVLDGNARADNEKRIRVDVFKKNNKYYLVPIYVADSLKEKLPNKACVAHKPYEEWEDVDNKDFLFSLFYNDLIFVKHRNENGIKLKLKNKESSLPKFIEKKECFLYYKGMDPASGNIDGCTHDNSYEVHGLGARTLESIQKYTVDVLGEIHKVEKEPRLPFSKKGK